MKTVICPIIGQPIDGDMCYRTILVMDGEAPEKIAPNIIKLTPEAKKICLSCKYHADEE